MQRPINVITPNNTNIWQMGFNSAFKRVKSPNNTSKWQMGFNSAFKGLAKYTAAVIRRTGLAPPQGDQRT
jgi:hypothetical protein